MGTVLLSLQANPGPLKLSQYVSSAILSMISALILIGMLYTSRDLSGITPLSMFPQLGIISWHQLGIMALFSCGRMAKKWMRVVVSISAVSFAPQVLILPRQVSQGST